MITAAMMAGRNPSRVARREITRKPTPTRTMASMISIRVTNSFSPPASQTKLRATVPFLGVADRHRHAGAGGTQIGRSVLAVFLRDSPLKYICIAVVMACGLCFILSNPSFTLKVLSHLLCECRTEMRNRKPNLGLDGILILCLRYATYSTD